jgi:hypothetical protein
MVREEHLTEISARGRFLSDWSQQADGAMYAPDIWRLNP